jgi:hypothetical protein
MLVSTDETYQPNYGLDSPKSLPPTDPPAGWPLNFAPVLNKNNYAVVLKRKTTTARECLGVP